MNRKKSSSDKIESFLPLTAAVFEIMLSLADGEKHGYAIWQEVNERTDGKINLLPGTLYRGTSRLLESGLLEETAERTGPEGGDERRRYYKLTHLGRRVLQAEAERLARQVQEARARKLVRNLGRRG